MVNINFSLILIALFFLITLFFFALVFLLIFFFLLSDFFSRDGGHDKLTNLLHDLVHDLCDGGRVFQCEWGIEDNREQSAYPTISRWIDRY